jgi:hypothetical protein
MTILKPRSLSYALGSAALGAAVGFLLYQQRPTRPDCEDGRWVSFLVCQQSRARPADCDNGPWIESVMDNGHLIGLGDGSLWQVDTKDTAKTSAWRPISHVIICGSRFANVDDNTTARVKRLR